MLHSCISNEKAPNLLITTCKWPLTIECFLLLPDHNHKLFVLKTIIINSLKWAINSS